MRNGKKLGIVFLSVLLVASLCVPVLSFAEPGSSTSTAEATIETVNSGEVSASDAKAPGSCSATIRYYEAVSYEEPGVTPDEQHRYLLGTRTIEGLSVGDVLDAWDYVVDIKGYFFFDGWPSTLTVSSNAEDNVIELIYVRLWNYSFNVNYYLMIGADLTASNWSDALSPDTVEFKEIASNTYYDQPYGALVTMNDFDYAIDDTYLVGSYPSEIRVGTQSDQNALNILYVPGAAHLPDDFVIQETQTPPSEDNPGNGTGSNPGNSSSGDVTSPTTPPASSDNQDSMVPPPDQPLNKDETATQLPDQTKRDEALELFQSYIETEQVGESAISDDMSVIDRGTARQIIAAYNTGLQEGKESCAQSPFNHIMCMIIMFILLVIAITFLVLYLHKRSEYTKLKEQLQASDTNGPAHLT